MLQVDTEMKCSICKQEGVESKALGTIIEKGEHSKNAFTFFRCEKHHQFVQVDDEKCPCCETPYSQKLMKCASQAKDCALSQADAVFVRVAYNFDAPASGQGGESSTELKEEIEAVDEPAEEQEPIPESSDASEEPAPESESGAAPAQQSADAESTEVDDASDTAPKTHAASSHDSAVNVEGDESPESSVTLGAATRAAPARRVSFKRVEKKTEDTKSSELTDDGFQKILAELRSFTLRSSKQDLRNAKEWSKLLKGDSRLEALKSTDPAFYLLCQDFLSGKTLELKEAQFDFNSALSEGIDFGKLDEELTVEAAQARRDHLFKVLEEPRFKRVMSLLFEGHVHRNTLQRIYHEVELRNVKAREVSMKDKTDQSKKADPAQADLRAQIEEKWAEFNLEDPGTLSGAEVRQVLAEELRGFDRVALTEVLDALQRAEINRAARGAEVAAVEKNQQQPASVQPADVSSDAKRYDLLVEMAAFDAAEPSTEHGATIRQAAAENVLAMPRELLRQELSPQKLAELQQAESGKELDYVKAQHSEEVLKQQAEKAKQDARLAKKARRVAKVDRALHHAAVWPGAIGMVVFLVISMATGAFLLGGALLMVGWRILYAIFDKEFLLKWGPKLLFALAGVTTMSGSYYWDAPHSRGAIKAFYSLLSKKAVKDAPRKKAGTNSASGAQPGSHKPTSRKADDLLRPKASASRPARKSNCEELIKKAGGSKQGDQVVILGCEKKGVEAGVVPAGGKAVIIYVRGGILAHTPSGRVQVSLWGDGVATTLHRFPEAPREAITATLNGKYAGYFKNTLPKRLRMEVVNRTNVPMSLRLYQNGHKEHYRFSGDHNGKPYVLRLRVKIYR